MLDVTGSNKAILIARCFLWWIIQQGYYQTDHSLLFHYMPLLASAYMCQLYHIWIVLALAPSIKFDGFAEGQWPVNAQRPLRWRQLYNVAIPFPLHRKLLHCTTTVQGLDSEMYGMIILIPKPPSLKLHLIFLLTPWLHYLLISSPQKCSARSKKALKSFCFLHSFSGLCSLLLTRPSFLSY